MARRKSEFLGAWGKAFEVFKALTDEVLASGGGDEDIDRIQSDVTLRKAIVKLILTNVKTATNLFPLVVDYTHSLAQMIASGKYDWVNPDITEKSFPPPSIPSGLPTKAEINLELLHFNHDISSNDVLKEMDKQGYRPATIQELLAFGAKYPEKQREYPIVALGSSWRDLCGDRHVAYLDRNASYRDLNLYWFDDEWNEICRFAAVRK